MALALTITNLTAGQVDTSVGLVPANGVLAVTVDSVPEDIVSATAAKVISYTVTSVSQTTAIVGGTIDNTVIGGTTPAAGTFSAGTFSALHVDTGTKTATAASGAATLSKMAGVITTESLTTAAGADYTLTLTNSDVAAADQVFASVYSGSSTAGTPAVTTVKPASGSVVIVIQNIHATAAFNGTLIISFLVVKN